MGIADVTEGPVSYFTVFAFLISAIVAVFLFFPGLRQGNAGLIVAGLGLGVVALIGVITSLATGGGILRSDASIFVEAGSFWIGRLVILVPSIGARERFSGFLSAPSQEGHILSGFLAQTSDPVPTIVNVFQAPIVENLFALAIGSVVYLILDKLLDRVGIQSILARAAGAILAAGWIFVSIHGAGRSAGFQLQAFTLMAVWVGLLILADKEVITGPTAAVATFLFTAGMHSGFNILASGGYFAYIGELQAATGDVAIAAQAILAFEVISFAIFALWIVQVVWSRGLSSLR